MGEALASPREVIAKTAETKADLIKPALLI
jgi:hypothetical protein